MASSSSQLLDDAEAHDVYTVPSGGNPGHDQASGGEGGGTKGAAAGDGSGSSRNMNNSNGNINLPSSWEISDFGRITEYSRDGSPHATDEVFNSASHLAGFMFSVLGGALLISGASAKGEPWKIVSFSIYAASLLFLFGASTLHHSITAHPIVEHRLRMMDYVAIYPLIGGSFTPLCLVFFHGSTVGWSFFAVVWTLAIAGMVLTLTVFHKIPKWLSTTIYVSIGWLGAFLTCWLRPYLGWGGLSLLVLGGLFFTGGGYVFSVERPNPFPGTFGFHEIWHVAVLLGAISHWLVMYMYVLPWEPDDDTISGDDDGGGGGGARLRL